MRRWHGVFAGPHLMTQAEPTAIGTMNDVSSDGRSKTVASKLGPG